MQYALGGAALYMWYRSQDAKKFDPTVGRNSILTNKGQQGLIGALNISARDPVEVRRMNFADTSSVGIPVLEQDGLTFTKPPRPTNKQLKLQARVNHNAVVNRVRRRWFEPFKGDKRFPIPISDGQFPEYYPGMFALGANEGAGNVSVSGRIRDHWK